MRRITPLVTRPATRPATRLVTGVAIALACVCGLAVTSPMVFAGGSPPAREKPADTSVTDYNRGTKLLFDGKYDQAIPHLRAAIKAKATFAEAHNNLAFCLRKKGKQFYQEALKHYNRAITINKKLAEPYMYRGVLHVQMGNLALARKDLAQLTALKSPLVTELQWVIDNGREKAPDQFFGVRQPIKK